jgi:coenzyme Q-binding protein COQ10
MPGATRSIVVNAPMEKVFDTIIDYPNYGTFAAELRDVKVGKRTGNEVEVTYAIEIIKTVRYTLRHKEERPNKVSWSFVEGEIMKDNKGSWLLEPAAGGATKVTYNIELTLGLLVPKTVVNMLTEQGLPKMLEAFKRRVETR